jgi:hypothetical protein
MLEQGEWDSEGPADQVAIERFDALLEQGAGYAVADLAGRGWIAQRPAVANHIRAAGRTLSESERLLILGIRR